MAPGVPLNARESSFGYRSVTGFLGMNKNMVQRIFQLIGRLVRKQVADFYSLIPLRQSVAWQPNTRLSTDQCGIRGDCYYWLGLPLVSRFHSRISLGLRQKGLHRKSGFGAGLDGPLRRPGPFSNAVPSAFRQRPSLTHRNIARANSPVMLLASGFSSATSTVHNRRWE